MPAKATTSSIKPAKATSRGTGGKTMKITMYIKSVDAYYSTPKKLVDGLTGQYWLQDIASDWAVTAEIIDADEFEKALS